MKPDLPATFERFMEQALHHPEHGYYARRITAIGRGGDFTTAPMISQLLARAVAGWAATAMRETGCRNLIEIGPGEGRLATAVLQHLPWTTRLRTRLHLVESSPALTDRQQALLGHRAEWHRHPAEALDACGGRALIYSNELVDAFPVRRFRLTRLGWQELALDAAGAEILLEPASLPDSSSFAEDHPEGQWIEVHDSYRRWLGEWQPRWKAGRMLTIDYGAESAQIYHRRPRGTVRAYLMQQRIEGPEIYRHPGRQDITADVNFTDLIRWSGKFTSSSELLPLADFARRHTAAREIVDHALLDPHGAGGAFLALDQKR
jgi:SAM-dependent MidA family methyltransferase